MSVTRHHSVTAAEPDGEEKTPLLFPSPKEVAKILSDRINIVNN